MGVKTAKGYEEYETSAKNRDLFSALNQSCLAHPNTGQISRKTNVDAVKMSLRNLVLTNKYERLRNREFGGNVRRWLFEPSTDLVGITAEIERHIREIVRNNEPRVRLLEVKATGDNDQNMVNVYIQFSIVSSERDEDLNITLYRVR